MDRNSYFHGADFCVLGHCTDLWGATGISFLCIVPVIWYTAVLNICTLWESSSKFSSLCRWVCFTSLIILNSQWPLRGKNERSGKKNYYSWEPGFAWVGTHKLSCVVGLPREKGALATTTATATTTEEKQQAWLANQQLFTCFRTFLYISLPSWLDDYEVKMPNFTFYGERKQGTTNFFFLFLNLSAVPKKSTPGKLAHISHFQWIGINATKFEKTRVILKVAFSQPSPSSIPYCGGRFISCVLVVLFDCFSGLPARSWRFEIV